MMFDLSNKVVLVTGGAGLLGEMHSQAIVENGGKVIIGDINLEATKKVCDTINSKYPGKAYPVYLNVLDKTSIQNVLEMCVPKNRLIDNDYILQYDNDVTYSNYG